LCVLHLTHHCRMDSLAVRSSLVFLCWTVAEEGGDFLGPILVLGWSAQKGDFLDEILMR
jgi:hypothetical protein